MTASGYFADHISQVAIGAAMRARDVSRRAEDDLERAEREVVVAYRPPSATSSGRGGRTPEAS